MKLARLLVSLLTSVTAFAVAIASSQELFAAIPTLTLKSGDNVTLSSTSTSNANNQGTSVNGNQSTYTASGSSYAIQTNGTAILTLNGGTVNGNGGSGIDAEGNGLITISGGTINAGSMGYGVSDNGSPITINGGLFSTTGTDFNSKSGTISLYGNFTDPSGKALAVGQTETLAGGGATGYFTGTLEKASTQQTFSYMNSGPGTITLYDTRAAAPEPSEWAAMTFTVFGIGGLLLRARRRSVQSRA